MNPVLIGNAFSWAGAVLATLLFLSPLQTCLRIVKEKSVSQYDATPYFASAMNCGLWVSYAFVTPNRLAAGVTNVIGGTLQITWLCVFTYYSAGPQKQSMVKRIFMVVTAWLAITLLDVFLVPKMEIQPFSGMSLQTELLGFCCVLFNILMYGSPLAVVKTVMKTRSVEFMPLPLSVMTLLCSGCWFSYSIYVRDPWMFIPNVLGVFFGFLQLSIYAYYSRQSSKTTQDLEALLVH